MAKSKPIKVRDASVTVRLPQDEVEIVETQLEAKGLVYPIGVILRAVVREMAEGKRPLPTVTPADVKRAKNRSPRKETQA